MNWRKDVLLFIAELKHIESQDGLDYEIRRKAMDKSINIVVRSPETHNFSQQFHTYNPLRMTYVIPIRGWNGTRVERYTYEGIDMDLIIRAIHTMNYGRAIFSALRNYYPKGVSSKDTGYLTFGKKRKR